MTKVINIKDAPAGWKTNPDYVYIGRPGKGMKGKWGNPFVLSNDTEDERVAMYEAYRKWTLRDPAYLAEAVTELSGKTLVCFCKPKLCHGDWLAHFIDMTERLRPRSL